MKKRLSNAEFKTKIVLEAISGEMDLTKYDVLIIPTEKHLSENKGILSTGESRVEISVILKKRKN